jgi:hypothetical protein
MIEHAAPTSSSTRKFSMKASATRLNSGSQRPDKGKEAPRASTVVSSSTGSPESAAGEIRHRGRVFHNASSEATLPLCASLSLGRTFLQGRVDNRGIDARWSIPDRNNNGQSDSQQRYEQHYLNDGQLFSRLMIHFGRLLWG